MRKGYDFHCDDATKSEPLRNLLDSFNLLQPVNSPTHKTGHALYLVTNSDSDNLVSSVALYPDLISDHHCTALTLNALKPSTASSVIAKRNFRNMDAAAFCDDIKSACSTTYVCPCLRSVHRGVNIDLQRMSFRPRRQARSLRNLRIKKNSPHPGYDAEVDEPRGKRRFCENIFGGEHSLK